MNPEQMKNIRNLIITIISEAKVEGRISQEELDAVTDYLVAGEVGNFGYQNILEMFKK